MKKSKSLINNIKNILPSPFTISILLTIVTFLLAIVFTKNSNADKWHPFVLLDYWNKGFWDLLKFSMQMTIMLILGHVLATSKPIDYFISIFMKLIKDTSSAAVITAILTLIMSFFNWGLGLIFGAIFVRKVGDYCLQNNIKINYPLIGAAGYCGLMVWHGGLSGSAPLIVAEEGHFFSEQIGIVSFDKTIFSTMNVIATLLFLTLVPLLLFIIGKKSTPTFIPNHTSQNKESDTYHIAGAEKLDHSKLLGMSVGLVIVFLSIRTVIKHENLNFINPNYINFLLLGLTLSFHQSIHSFLKATENAVGGSIGIIIQFPFYAGIMGIMKFSGLVDEFSNFFVANSTANSFPLFAFFSAGLVNIFVPSGGGQWAVQGEIIITSCKALNIPVEKGIMALVYGDQLTNMLQPFWALPLLGITKLKAKEIFPYSALIMMVGILISCFVLLFF